MISILLDCAESSVQQWLLNVWDQANKLDIDTNSVIQYSAIIAGFISVTLPIALDMISKHTEDFKDKEIAEIFPKHGLYQFQLYANLLIVFVSILMIAFKITSGILILFIIYMDLVAIVMFIMFLRLIQEYATNFAQFYSDKLKKDSDEIVQGK